MHDRHLSREWPPLEHYDHFSASFPRFPRPGLHFDLIMLGARASTFPLPSRQTLEVDFLENRPSEFRRTAANCIFDTDKRQFAPLIPVGTVQTVSFEQDASEESEIQLRHTHDSFRTAVEALKETAASKNKTVATFQLSNAHSWGEVAKAAKDAEETYLKADSPTSKVRSAFRRIEKNAKSIKPFLGMLPDGEYKTLAGGLTLVLSVCLSQCRCGFCLIALGNDEESRNAGENGRVAR